MSDNRPLRHFAGWSLVAIVLAVALSAEVASAQLTCAEALATTTTSQARSESGLTGAIREAAIRIMVEGSMNVSRTALTGKMVFASPDFNESEVAVIAAENFRTAASFLVDNFRSLPVNLATAKQLVEILTRKIESDDLHVVTHELARTKFDFRILGKQRSALYDKFFDGTPASFYRWLDSEEAHAMQARDPIAFAEILHNNLIALDSFPDSNGRLSRMMADLVLLKAGLAPALYTSQGDYFARGSARSPVDRSVRQAYFREIVERGRAAVQSLLNSPVN